MRVLSASDGWWQYSLIIEQLTTSSHNYSFQIIKLGTLNVKRKTVICQISQVPPVETHISF